MKFKIAKPEDFTDVEGYEFKTIKAYTKLYFDFLETLIKTNSAINVYEESKHTEDDLKWFLDFLKRTIKEFEDTEETIQK